MRCSRSRVLPRGRRHRRQRPATRRAPRGPRSLARGHRRVLRRPPAAPPGRARPRDPRIQPAARRLPRDDRRDGDGCGRRHLRADEPTLDLFCDRVASAAGRLSVRIFGMPEAEGIKLSHHLGRALQLTNILRDIDDDAAINRCYLPRELLAREGIAITDPATIVRDPALPRVRDARRARARALPPDAVMDTCARAQVKARASCRARIAAFSKPRSHAALLARTAAQAEGAHADDRRALRAVLSRPSRCGPST